MSILGTHIERVYGALWLYQGRLVEQHAKTLLSGTLVETGWHGNVFQT